MQSLNKKGLSEVVQTSLIILLSISAIFAMWSYIGDLKGNLENQLSPVVGCLQQESYFESACINAEGKIEATMSIALSESITNAQFNINGESFSCGSYSCDTCTFTETENKKTIYLNPTTNPLIGNNLIAKINGCGPQSLQLTQCA